MAREMGIANRAHNPTKGIRVRLRNALRAAGITQKFRTDEARNLTLLVISKETFLLPFIEFEGRVVQFQHVS